MPDSSALAWFNFADAYYVDAAVLHTAKKPSGGFYAQPVHYLYFHAIELYLKSFLRLHGVSESELRSKQVGHDLIKLRTACELKGLPQIRVLLQVTGLAEAFQQPIKTRYIRTGPQVGVVSSRLHDACKKLRTLIAREFAAEGITPPELPELPSIQRRRSLTMKQAAKRIERLLDAS